MDASKMKNYFKSIMSRKKLGSVESITSDKQRQKFVSKGPMQPKKAGSSLRNGLSRKFTVISVINGNTNSQDDLQSKFGSKQDIERVISEIKKCHSKTREELKASVFKLGKELLSFFSFFVCYVLFGMFLFFYIEECSGATVPRDGTVYNAVDRFVPPSYTNLTHTCHLLFETFKSVAADAPVSWEHYSEGFFYVCGEVVVEAADPVLIIPQYNREKCHFDEFMLLKYAEFTIFTLLTIGYGNISPATNVGRICLIFYAAIGIPLAVTMYSVAGKLIVQAISLWIRIIEFRLWGVTQDPKLKLKALIVSIFFMFLVMLIGCSITSSPYMENLDFTSSIYFWFVSLTTIGFGDIHFDRDKHLAHPHLMMLASMNILFGLGLIAAIIKALSLTLESGNFNAIVIEQEPGAGGPDETSDTNTFDDEIEVPMNDVTKKSKELDEDV